MHYTLQISRKLIPLSLLAFPVLYSPALFSNPAKIQKQSTNQNCQANEDCKSKKTIRLFNKSEEKLKNAQDKEENIQLAQSRRCPVPMPEIESVVVFQSVEAPQIEPMNEQSNLPYDDYDLVEEKPAGVLVHIKTNFKKKVEKEHLYRMALHIGSNDNVVRRISCFREVQINKKMDSNDREPCSFTGNSLDKRGYYKFMPFPMFSLSSEKFLRQGRTNIPVKIVIHYVFNERNCKTEKTFRINLIKTKNLKLGFTRIYAGDSCQYSPVSYESVNDFANSDEVQHNIPSMFPVQEVSSNVLNYIWKGRNYNYVEGKCDNSIAKNRPKRTIGLLSDVQELENTRADLGYSKLIAIVPESYSVFHKGVDHESTGFIVHPLWRSRLFWIKYGFLGGSWNIAFVNEDRLNKKTTSHELAHSRSRQRTL